MVCCSDCSGISDHKVDIHLTVLRNIYTDATVLTMPAKFPVTCSAKTILLT